MKAFKVGLPSAVHSALPLTLVLFLSAGCAREPAAPAPSVTTIHIKPSELFKGELKRIEPHLSLTCGCVHLDYEGPQINLRLEVEVWINGKLTKRSDFQQGTWNGSGDASISIKNVIDKDGKEKLQVITVLQSEGISLSSTSKVDLPVLKEAGYGPKTLAEAIDLPGAEPVAVWGYMGGKGSGNHRGNESIEEMAKRVEWALVLKLSRGKEL
jgi:hypothetical protein